jgi:hypothetical protein
LEGCRFSGCNERDVLDTFLFNLDALHDFALADVACAFGEPSVGFSRDVGAVDIDEV